MALPMESPISFANVGQARWWQRGILASQTGYVAIALLVLLVVMHFASPYFLTEGNMQNVAKNSSPSPPSGSPSLSSPAASISPWAR